MSGNLDTAYLFEPLYYFMEMASEDLRLSWSPEWARNDDFRFPVFIRALERAETASLVEDDEDTVKAVLYGANVVSIVMDLAVDYMLQESKRGLLAEDVTKLEALRDTSFSMLGAWIDFANKRVPRNGYGHPFKSQFHDEAQLGLNCKRFKDLVPFMGSLQKLGSPCSVFLCLPGTLDNVSGGERKERAMKFGRAAAIKAQALGLKNPQSVTANEERITVDSEALAGVEPSNPLVPEAMLDPFQLGLLPGMPVPGNGDATAEDGDGIADLSGDEDEAPSSADVHEACGRLKFWK